MEESAELADGHNSVSEGRNSGSAMPDMADEASKPDMPDKPEEAEAEPEPAVAATEQDQAEIADKVRR